MKRFVLALALIVAGMPEALAMRPFDGTDAAVARRGTVEFEFGYLGLLRAGRERSDQTGWRFVSPGWALVFTDARAAVTHLLQGPTGGCRWPCFDRRQKCRTNSS
jgi:hypothetical protein